MVLRLTDTRGKCVDESGRYLVPFHGFSSVVKSLCVDIFVLPSSEIFDLVLSLPLLEDLTVVSYNALADENDDPDQLPTTALPSTPPMIGSLSLFRWEGLKPLARRLLSLPGDIHFQNINLTLLYEEDFSSATALVEGCSHVLKSLDISCECDCMSVRTCVRASNLLLCPAEQSSAPIARPLEVGGARGRDFLGQYTNRPLGHHGAPNYSTGPLRPSTSVDLFAFQRDPSQGRCRHRADVGYAVGGPRQPSHPNLEVAFNSPEDRVHKAKGTRTKRGIQFWGFVATGKGERDS